MGVRVPTKRPWLLPALLRTRNLTLPGLSMRYLPYHRSKEASERRPAYVWVILKILLDG
jgi:hypothetical protein